MYFASYNILLILAEEKNGFMAKVNESNQKNQEVGLKLLKSSVRFFLNRFYYRKVYSVNIENVPENCALMVVSNHQNSLCDPLGLLLSIRSRKERKHKIITRGSAFEKPRVNSFLRSLGLLPAYRLSVDGEEQLTNNTDTFEIVEDELLHNGTVIIFPEGKHQNKHWLGEFSTGYLRMLFQTAEKSNFEKELFILPTCNHYSDYFAVRGEMLIKFGKPVPLAPFYELYKTKPRTAQRQLNAIVWEQVSELMLNITDLDNYHAINFLRNTYGIRFAKSKGFNPEKLPEKLLSDKELCTKLIILKKINGELVQKVYNETGILKKEIRQNGIEDRDFERKNIFWNLFFQALLLIIFLPLYICAFIPNLLVLYIPRLINRKVKDPMMHSAVRILVSIFLTIPVSAILIFGITWIASKSFIIALICLFSFPLLSLFMSNYRKVWRRFKCGLRFYRLLKKGRLNEIIRRRQYIYETLDALFEIKLTT